MGGVAAGAPLSAPDVAPDPDEPHPSTEIDDLVHQRARLGILAVLVEAERADFAYLRRVLELTDGNLGRHLEVLRDQGLVATTKSVAGSRPRTWVSITDAGRAALAAEMGALRRLLERFDKHR